MAQIPCTHVGRVALLQVPVARQRPEREERAVAVIAEIEDAREADGGVFAPRPRGRDRPGSTEMNWMPRWPWLRLDVARRHQAEHRPGGLRRVETGPSPRGLSSQ